MPVVGETSSPIAIAVRVAMNDQDAVTLTDAYLQPFLDLAAELNPSINDSHSAMMTCSLIAASRGQVDLANYYRSLS